ncbi:MAG TPA: tyrosine-type recombinase/integrase, partial [Candidatus Acidoferrum sp.]|nr:tyrosine-type recombinase/integrase [Candidatus Acidoferrum sp.]
MSITKLYGALMPSLYTREKVPVAQKDGQTQLLWRYQRVREGRGVRTSSLPGPFYSRRKLNGRTAWAKLQQETFTEAKAEAGNLAEEVETAKTKVITGNRTTIESAVETYLDYKSRKARKTIMQYRSTLNQFADAIKDHAHFMDEITPDVLRKYKKFMEAEGYAGKTIDTRLNIVSFLLKKNGISARIPRDEMPTVETDPATPYSEADLKKLFAEMDEEETLLFKFFLATGARDREVTFASWADINFENKTYTIRGKADAGFYVKNHESRTIPLPDSLVALLKKAHQHKKHDRWIFVNKDGRPRDHSLRRLKQLALEVGLNCGHCKTTINVGRYKPNFREVSCEKHPTCEHI